jgi:ABC-2 type transport system permease protein
MRKFLWAVGKELTVLWRDRAALLILFTMPCALIFVVTLVQENVMRETSQNSFQILLVNEDNGELSETMIRYIQSSTIFKPQLDLDGKPITRVMAERSVAAGEVPIAVIFEKDLTRNAVQNADGMFDEDVDSNTLPSGSIRILFDPGVSRLLRESFMTMLQLRIVEAESKLAVTRLVEEILEEPTGKSTAEIIEDDSMWVPGRSISIRSESPSLGDSHHLPNSVQQNVPAWMIFGIFLIAVPLSGTFIRERQEGTLIRIRSMPVSTGLILFSKITAYVIISLIQLPLMLSVGFYLLPLAGTPVLTLGMYPCLIVVTAVFAALAATSFGLFIGSFATSTEQTSLLSAVTVVIAAAIGGIMVPTFAMPSFMQTLAGFSPLEWAHHAMITLIVRHGSFGDIWRDLAYLLLFSLLCSTLSISKLMGRNR